jgi:multidrug efflux pump
VEVDSPGASAAVVETRVTQVLEDALSGIEGVDTIQSSSVNGRASVSMEFSLARDIEGAANDVRGAVSRVADRLPDEADQIIQLRLEPAKAIAGEFEGGQVSLEVKPPDLGR